MDLLSAQEEEEGEAAATLEPDATGTSNNIFFMSNIIGNVIKIWTSVTASITSQSIQNQQQNKNRHMSASIYLQNISFMFYLLPFYL